MINTFHMLTPLGLNNICKPFSRPLLAMVRDKHVEGLWSGSGLVVDTSGQIQENLSASQDYRLIARSAIKPIHAAILVEALQQKGLSPQTLSATEWALLSGSQSARPEGREALKSLLKRFDISPNYLVCGSHAPLDKAAAEDAIRNGRQADSLDHQCVGHHTGQLILSKLLGAPLSDYANPEGKVQQYLLERIRDWSGQANVKLIRWDGCNIPSIAIPHQRFGQLYANWATKPGGQFLTQTAKTHPTLFGKFISSDENIDGHLIRMTRGRLFSKAGNDGLLCVVNTALEKPKAFILKIWSGNGNTSPVRDKVAIQALSDLKWITPEEVKALKALPNFQEHENNTIGLANGQRKVSYISSPLPWKRLSICG